MNEKLKGFGEKLKSFFGKLSRKTKILLGVALALLIVGAAAVAIVLNNKPYTVLFTGLNGEEASAIMTYLEENGAANYRLENNNTILVPRDQETTLKAKLLMAGYPKSGFAYESYFENVSSLSTESERNFAFLAALEEKMRAVIRCFEGVRDANVTIVQGESQTYVLEDAVAEASAAVQVTMTAGQKLSSEQASAIRNLVARAVKGLKIDNITLADTWGNVYPGGDSSEISDASMLKLELENQVNNQVRTQVMQVLIPFYGEENVKVGVNSTVDVNRTVGDSITYTLPEYAQDGETDGRGIIGSEVYSHSIIRGDETGAGGVVGTQSNADINTYMESQLQPDGSERELSTSGQKDYKVDEYKETIERTSGVITDCMISVSINSTTAGTVDVLSLLPHVARAAGISDELAASKISILPLPFYVEPQPVLPPDIEGNGMPDWIFYAALGGGALFLLLLILFLLLHGRRKKKKKAAQQAAAAAANANEFFQPTDLPEPVPAGADVMDLRTEKSMELRKDIRQFADDNPEIAAQMVRAWLKGGEDNG